MELLIKAYLKDGLIVFDYENLKNQLKEYLQKYQDYSIQSYSDAKSDRANLRKFISALETKRKDIKNLVLRQYNKTFEPQIKELVEMVEVVVEEIDSKIKKIEESEEINKLQLIQNLFKEQKFNLVTLEQIFDERWLNRSMTISEVETLMIEKINKIKSDLMVIDGYFDKGLKARYLRELDLNKVLVGYNIEQKILNQMDGVETLTRQIIDVTMSKVTLEVIAPKDVLLEIGDYLRAKGVVFNQLTDIVNYEE